MSDSKLITLDLLKQFSEKCKQTFSPAHKLADGSGDQFILKIGVNLNNCTSKMSFSGSNEEGYVEAILYCGADNLFVSKGSIEITEAFLYKSTDYSLIYITLNDTVSNFSVDYFITKEDQLVNCVTDFKSTSFTSPTDCEELNILYDNISDQGASFQIVDANKDIFAYPNTDTFTSIYEAGVIKNVTFAFENSDKQVTTDIEKNSAITLPSLKYTAGNNVSIDSNNKISVSIPTASDSTKGIVQIGKGIKCEDGVISVSVEQASYYNLGTIKVNGPYEEGTAPVKITDDGFAYVETEDADPHRFEVMPSASEEWSGRIVEYIGKTNVTYTQGYFYICFPDYEISVPCLSEIDSNVNTGAYFAKYVQDLKWSDGNIINPSELKGSWSYSYIDGVLKIFDSERSFSIPKEDFSKFNMKVTSEDYSSGIIYFSGDNFVWTQQNVQPIAYLDTDALEFMTDADTDSIFTDPITEIKVLNYDTMEKIPSQYVMHDGTPIILSVSPSEVVYSYTGTASLNYNEDGNLVLNVTPGKGSITFKSIVYPEITKTINISYIKFRPGL